MSAIPQGAFAARAVKRNLEFSSKNMKMHTIRESDYEKSSHQYRTKVFEHPPLKYNSKLMNSIWGLYNRYSVHNFKKNTDGSIFAVVGEHLN